MPKKELKEELKSEISWRAAEFRYVEKGPGWYVVVAALGLILIVVALIQKNFFFALFILLAGTTIFYFGRRRPRVMDFRVNDEGVGFGKETFYRYDDLESFSVVERPNQLNEVILKRKTSINPYVRLPIDAKLAVTVKKLLGQKIKEVDYEPSVIDMLGDWLGF